MTYPVSECVIICPNLSLSGEILVYFHGLTVKGRGRPWDLSKSTVMAGRCSVDLVMASVLPEYSISSTSSILRQEINSDIIRSIGVVTNNRI